MSSVIGVRLPVTNTTVSLSHNTPKEDARDVGMLAADRGAQLATERTRDGLQDLLDQPSPLDRFRSPVEK
jgi:hypothetical protein